MKIRHSLLALPALVAVFVIAMPEIHAQTPTAAQAAQRLIEVTAPAQRGELLLPFTEALRSDWNYTPRRRDGLAWKAMSTAQREATTALLRTALNERGLDKVRAVMALEITLRQLEAFGFSRDPENYALAIYGEPGVGGWGWRIEGHHLSLHFSLEGDRYVSTLPQFFGANPAVVPRDVGGGAPREGFRLLGSEEDLARQWLASLTPPQRARAIFDTRPFGDIVSRNAARAQAAGCRGAAVRGDGRRPTGTSAETDRRVRRSPAAGAHPGAPRACARGSTRFDPSRLGWIGPAASAALLSHPGRELPHRVRQLGRQPHPLGVARLRR